jgi:hypothetical protein
MQKQIKKGKRRKDINQLAYQLVELSTSSPTGEIPPFPRLSEYMAAIGSRGGKIGGKRRLETMSAKERRAVARKAARARWEMKGE